MMASGASAGSTSGGIKIIRELIAIKSINNIFRRLLHPNALFSVKVSHEVIDDEKTRRVINFLIIFMLLYILGVLLLIISGSNLQESMFNCVSALGNSGPGIGNEEKVADNVYKTRGNENKHRALGVSLGS